MTVHSPNRGGAPVGFLTELPPIEASAVMCFRLWQSRANDRHAISQEFGQIFGPEYGDLAFQALDAICDLCMRHGRRPLLRHQVTCKCLGADEACFANFVAAASEGAREDAMLIATLIVRPDFAPSLVGLAEEFGFALRRVVSVRNTQPSAFTRHETTLH